MYGLIELLLDYKYGRSYLRRNQGQGGEQTKRLEERSKPFKHIAAMCNTIKHVRAFRGGSNEAVVTVRDVTGADSTTVLFTDEVDGSLKSFRPENEILIFVYNDNGMHRNIWVGVEQFCTLRFVAKELNCEGLVYAKGLPNEVNLVYDDYVQIRRHLTAIERRRFAQLTARGSCSSR